jgi:alpha-D-xyloside xylohydrolase
MEPDMWPLDPDDLRYHLGPGLAITNIYPLMYARGIYEGMRSENEEEFINLCRCAWVCSQRDMVLHYGPVIFNPRLNR